MAKDFLSNTSIIEYSDKNYEKNTFSLVSDINLTEKNGQVKWLNTYGINFKEEFEKKGVVLL